MTELPVERLRELRDLVFSYVPGGDQRKDFLTLIDSALSGERREYVSITDRLGVTAQINTKTGFVRVFDQHGNDYATGPSGLIGLMYRSDKDEPYLTALPTPAPNAEAGEIVFDLRLVLSFVTSRAFRHHECEDPFYSCPKHPNYCGNSKRDICECGADEAMSMLKHVRAAIVYLERPAPASEALKAAMRAGARALAGNGQARPDYCDDPIARQNEAHAALLDQAAGGQ